MNRPTSPSRRPAWPIPALIGLLAVVAIVLIVMFQGSDEDAQTPTAQGEDTAPVEQPADPDTGEDNAPSNETNAEPGVQPGSEAPTNPGGAEAPPTTVDRGDTPDMTFVERRDEADPLAIGPVDAPVTLVVFTDYQCPYCAKWSHETFPELESYVDAGDLRVEWRDVNIFGDPSERGARATYAAALQDEFTLMQGALFADGMARSESELTDERLRDLARELGLDGEQFDADYDAQSTADEVSRNQREGLDIGAFSTPAFVLGGTPIVGAQPADVFITAMDDALAAVQNAG